MAGTSFIVGPLVGLLALGLLVLLLRWTYAHGSSLVAAPARSGDPAEYGLLVEVAAPDSDRSADALVGQLAAAGIRATVAPTTEGRRIMVFAADADQARRQLARRGSA